MSTFHNFSQRTVHEVVKWGGGVEQEIHVLN